MDAVDTARAYLDIGTRVGALSDWVDNSPSYVGLDPEAHLRRRTDKVGEEHGEMIAAIGGMVGENPRKGKTHTQADVEYELLDVATAALGALFHITGGDDVMARLGAHVEHVWRRAGLDGSTT